MKKLLIMGLRHGGRQEGLAQDPVVPGGIASRALARTASATRFMPPNRLPLISTSAAARSQGYAPSADEHQDELSLMVQNA